MSAATAEVEAETGVPLAAPAKGKEFASRRADLRLILEPAVDQYAPNGNMRPPIPGIAVRFVNHRLVVPDVPQGNDKEPMMRCELARKVPSPQVLEMLEAHPLFGDTHEGFWSAQTPAPLPTASDIGKITDLAIELDVDGLLQLISVEEDGWGREALLTPARDALQKATAAKAQIDEKRDAALSDAEAAGEAKVRDAAKAAVKAG